MNPRWGDSVAAAGPASLLALVLAGAALAGMATAVVGSVAGLRTIYYVAIFGVIAAGMIVTMTRDEPLRFAFLALIVCLPVASAAVPPGRLTLTVFDAVMAVLAVWLVGKRLLGRGTGAGPIFPTASLLIPWLIAAPCVAFSQFPATSLQLYLLHFAAYAFFLLALEELRRDKGLERLVLLLAVVLLVMAAGCFVDSVLHVNLSLRGSNLNQLSYAYGFEIYRAGGFFQDPQKAGAYLGSMIAFLLVLGVRGRLRAVKLRFLLWTATVLGLGALVTTVSRAAIAACLSVSAIALFAFNRWNPAIKLLIAAGVIVAAFVLALTPIDTWMSIVPAAVSERFRHSHAEFLYRTEIWFDTWNMFADHPLTGIGFGSFQPYLMKTQPTVFNYYDLGSAQGVAYVPDNPESGYFKVLYEGGIAGSLAVLIVAFDALRRAIAVIAGSADPDARTEAIAALTALLVFGLTFVTLFTPSDPRVAALVAFLLAVIWHRSLQVPQTAQKG
jgi:O-antigen ligase